MNISIYRSQLSKAILQRNGYLLLACGVVMVCILQSILVFFLIERERVVIVPPQVEKSFWVSGQGISPEYLAEMATFFSSLRLNVTPETATLQRETILRYTDPEYYGQLKTQLVEEADKILEQHLSIAFYPNEPRVDSKALKALVEGDLKTTVGDSPLPTRHVKYLVQFHYKAGRLLIMSFKELKNA